MDRALTKDAKRTYSFLKLKFAVLIGVKNFEELFGDCINFKFVICTNLFSFMFVVLFTYDFFEGFLELLVSNLVTLFVLHEFGHNYEKSNLLEHGISLNFLDKINKFSLLHKPLDELLGILE